MCWLLGDAIVQNTVGGQIKTREIPLFCCLYCSLFFCLLVCLSICVLLRQQGDPIVQNKEGGGQIGQLAALLLVCLSSFPLLSAPRVFLFIGAFAITRAITPRLRR